ncbi:RAQPRD family integrative conjugative element protein [Azospira restricta]|uniref:RAQPRD family integrative conjugative element protein n=1 Tax=Azospira restricta TaxID=404405 RepID=A0A974SQG3_9RHOO|nr:RAQPRD family integrative conjugative element protein [Azospira restricta]QRJ64570.1 RAQPRD family integrative conjugative element protein [Azospira restricta]
MGQTCQGTSLRPRLMAVLSLSLAVSLSALHPAHAGDDASEREQVAALARQLDLIDRLAEHAAHTAPQERARYHFDYARLRADLNRVRAGLQDYLVPQRAQPRDPVPLAGDYVRRDRADDEEPSP